MARLKQTPERSTWPEKWPQLKQVPGRSTWPEKWPQLKQVPGRSTWPEKVAAAEASTRAQHVAGKSGRS
ncbi:hypothetical protein V2J29_18545 [Bacillus altitudinis]|nr:hypothetical protein [Bacillus altitudinis]MEE4397248.1 hypothetical protein [Bacillus altitudinis]